MSDQATQTSCTIFIISQKLQVNQPPMFGSIQISFICFFYTSSFWTTITFPFTFTLLRPPFSKRSMSWTWCEMVLSWTSTQPPLRIFLLDLLPEDPDDWWLWDWLWVWVFRVDAKNVEIFNINHWELEVIVIIIELDQIEQKNGQKWNKTFHTSHISFNFWKKVLPTLPTNYLQSWQHCAKLTNQIQILRRSCSCLWLILPSVVVVFNIIQ